MNLETSNTPPWIRYIDMRLHKSNKNFLGFFSGKTGSGKSYSSISVCEQIDKNFTVNNVVFSTLELLELINSGKLKRGSAICFEEMGVDANVRSWMSKTNKTINYLLQTFRKQGFCLIMNSPYIEFIDSATRKLFHAEFRTSFIDKEHDVCVVYPRLLYFNQKKQIFGGRRLIIRKNKVRCKINSWGIPKPSEKLVEEYELKKDEYIRKTNLRLEAELRAGSISGEEKQRALQPRQSATLKFLTEKPRTLRELSNLMGISPIQCRYSISNLITRGYIFKITEPDPTIRPKQRADHTIIELLATPMGPK